MSFDSYGIDEFSEELNSTSDELVNLQAEDLFTDDFVRRYTQFSSYEEMLDRAVSEYSSED